MQLFISKYKYTLVAFTTLSLISDTIFSLNWDPKLSYEHKLSEFVIARLNGSHTCRVLTYLCCRRDHDPLETAEYAIQHQHFEKFSPATYSTLMTLSVSGQITHIPTLIRINHAITWYENKNRIKPLF
jgi:hypothetical protein